MTQQVRTSGESRIWIQPRGCNSQLLYGGCYGMGDVTIPEGDITYIRCPSPEQVNKWDIVGSLIGTPGNKTTSLEAPYGLVNYLLSIRCQFNIQVRMGVCSRPDDPTGWERMLAFEGARITSRGVQNINPRSPDSNEQVLVTADITFDEMYDVHTHEFSSTTVSATANAAIEDIAFCDSPSCAGPCGIGSVGCQVGYVVISATPGELWKTEDGGSSWTQLAVAWGGSYGTLKAVDCSNDIVIVVNGSATSEIARSSDGGDTWTVIDVGGSQTVNDVFMLDSANVWLCGAGGYVWYSNDGGLTWEMQTEGTVTANALEEIHFADTETGIAVGAAGTLLRTITGGATWSLVVVDAALVDDLYTVFCVSDIIMWIAGENAALYYSMDGGQTWTEKTWSGSATDGINSVTFCGCMFGFFGATTFGGAGRLFSTTDGGYTFREETLPTNAGINAVHCCDPNTIFVGTNDDGLLLAAV